MLHLKRAGLIAGLVALVCGLAAYAQVVIQPAKGGGGGGSSTHRTYYPFVAGDSQNGTPAAGFNWTAANNSLVNPANRTGSNTVFAVLPFPKAASPEVQANFYLTPDYVAATAIRAEILWSSIGTGAVKWIVKTGVVAPGAAFDSALATTTTGTTSIGTANTSVITTINITDPSAVAGGILFFSISRQVGDAADTLTTPADLVNVVFSITTNN